MQITTQPTNTKTELLNKFTATIKNKIPYLETRPSGPVIVNATPLVDITSLIEECARTEYGLDISNKRSKIFAKLDSEILGGQSRSGQRSG